MATGRVLSGGEVGMAVGTSLSRLSGLARILALSFALGVTPLADAYNLANTAPNMIYDLLVGGVLSATLVPVFVASLDRDDDGAGSDGVNAVLSAAAVALVAATVLTVLVAPRIVAVYTAANHVAAAPAERAAATTLLRWFAPQIACYGVIAMLTAVLNVRGRFALPMFVPIVNNVVVIVALVAVSRVFHDLTLHGAAVDPRLLVALGLGTTAGVVAQALALVPRLRGTGVVLRWRWAPRDPALGQVLRLSGWLVGIVVANQLALFVVLLLANADPGGVTAYTYAYTFFQLPFGVIAVSIMTARQPRWARLWRQQRPGVLWHDAVAGVRLLSAVIVPVAVLVAVVAVPLLQLLLAHGRTSASGAQLAGSVLAILALGLPGFSAYLYAVRVYQAMHDTRAAFGLYLVENGLNVVVALALYRSAGVRGVAASVSVAYTVSAFVAWRRLRRRLVGDAAPRLRGAADAAPFAASAVSGASGYLVAAAIGSGGDGHRLAAVVTATVVMTGCYVVVAAAAGDWLRAARVLRRNRDSRNGVR